jgi:hypothetical protein
LACVVMANAAATRSGMAAGHEASLAWSQQAGVGQWKVDGGIGLPGKLLWKFKVTPQARAVAPDVWIEFGTQGDLYRTYDVNLSVSIPETLPLPRVSVPEGKDAPYVLGSRHPDGESAVATISRNPGAKGRPRLVFPLADVALDVGELTRPVGMKVADFVSAHHLDYLEIDHSWCGAETKWTEREIEFFEKHRSEF